MDRSKCPSTEGWFSERHVCLRCYGTSCTALFHFPSSLFPCSCCMANKESSGKKLVIQQEVIAQEIIKDRRFTERGLPSDLMVTVSILFHCTISFYK